MPDSTTDDYSGASGGGFLAGGKLLGTNALQKSIDAFTTAVDKLDSIYTKASSTAQSFWNAPTSSQSGNQFSTRQQQSQYGTFPKPVNPFTVNGGRRNAQTPTFGQTSSGNGGGASFTPTGSQSGGNGGWGRTTVGGGITALAGAFKNYGSSQLPTQVGMSAYVQQGTLASPLGMPGNMANSYLRSAAYGSGPGTLNSIASNAADASAGQSLINSTSGAFAGMNAGGAALTGAANMFGYVNPALGYAGSAGLATQMYSPQMAMRMMQLGYSTPSRSFGAGKYTSSPAVLGGMMQTMYGRNRVAQSTLNAGLGAYGHVTANLQALGYSGSGLNSMESTLQAYNRLSSQGYSNSKISSLFSGARSQNQGAINTLAAAGVDQSDLQVLKNQTAISTGRSSEVSGGFNTGLEQSVGLLNQFNKALSTILNGPLGTAVGHAGGIGAASSLTNGAALGLGIGGASTLAKGLLSRGGGGLLGGILGGGGGSAAAGGAGGAGTAAGAAGGLLGILGPLLATGAGLGLLGNAVRVRASQPGGILGGYDPNKDPAFFGRFGPVGGGANVQPSRNGGAAGAAKSSQQGGNKASVGGGSISGAASAAVGWAEQEVGKPYVWGGENPNVGFDCSGLVQWSYGKAGVSLPRTSQEQWAALSKRSVGLNQVREGDLVFTAGADGTAQSPGHVAMMISNNQIIEAAETGIPIRIRGYNPKEWQHAGRPSGSGATGGFASGSPPTSSTVTSGNAGLGFGLSSGAYGSSEESDTVMAALSGGFMGGGTMPSASSTAASGAGNGGNGAGASNAPGNPSGNVALGKKMAAAKGWTGTQWNDLYALWQRESGWRANAKNGASGAYGIPQSLPGSKMASAGSDWMSNPATQIKWGLGYIAGRYKNPAGAWAHEESVGWYGTGTGNARPGLALVGDRGPELVSLPGGAQVASASRTRDILSGNAARPAQSPWAVTPASAPGTVTPGAASGGGLTVNIQQGAIQLNATGGTSDVSSSAREIAKNIGKYLAQEDVVKQIAAGVTGG